MNKVRCFGVVNLFQQSVLFIELINTKYKQEYEHEIKRLMTMLQDINFEEQKKFQKIYTTYGIWYCTVDDHTSCAFLLLVNQQYPLQSALRLKKSLSQMVQQVPRYFDQNTGLYDKLTFKARDLLINYDIDEEYQNDMISTVNSIQTIDVKLDSSVPELLTQKDHLNIRKTIDPEIQKILDDHKKEKERRSTLMSSQIQNQIQNSYQQQQNSNYIKQESLTNNPVPQKQSLSQTTIPQANTWQQGKQSSQTNLQGTSPQQSNSNPAPMQQNLAQQNQNNANTTNIIINVQLQQQQPQNVNQYIQNEEERQDSKAGVVSLNKPNSDINSPQANSGEISKTTKCVAISIIIILILAIISLVIYFV